MLSSLSFSARCPIIYSTNIIISHQWAEASRAMACPTSIQESILEVGIASPPPLLIKDDISRLPISLIVRFQHTLIQEQP